jgi:toxin-antitoxin system PIN domain toxin
MTSSIFPDVNVWLALTYPDHVHHEVAANWLDTMDEAAIFVFCRQTQLGFFRLLTNSAVLGRDARTQRQCWETYDRWIDAGKAILAKEPAGLETELRSLTTTESVSTKEWADAYLSAFAQTARLTLVTFDRALAGKATGAVLLEGK